MSDIVEDVSKARLSGPAKRTAVDRLAELEEENAVLRSQLMDVCRQRADAIAKAKQDLHTIQCHAGPISLQPQHEYVVTDHVMHIQERCKAAEKEWDEFEETGEFTEGALKKGVGPPCLADAD